MHPRVPPGTYRRHNLPPCGPLYGPRAYGSPHGPISRPPPGQTTPISAWLAHLGGARAPLSACHEPKTSPKLHPLRPRNARPRRDSRLTGTPTMPFGGRATAWAAPPEARIRRRRARCGLAKTTSGTKSASILHGRARCALSRGSSAVFKSTPPKPKERGPVSIIGP
jgi:hypothetical protein